MLLQWEGLVGGSCLEKVISRNATQIFGIAVRTLRQAGGKGQILILFSCRDYLIFPLWSSDLAGSRESAVPVVVGGCLPVLAGGDLYVQGISLKR